MTQPIQAKGRFLFRGQEKLSIRGVTYGPFGPAGSITEYHDCDTVRHDFEKMVSANINAVRTYTSPPDWLLDIAHECGLHVMVGLAWEQHVTFLDAAGLSRAIVQRLASSVKICAGHPAVLCFSIGNEIPAPIVRWHGARRIEHFLREAYWRVKDEAPDTLLTYVNYPSTEYLRLPFLDLVSFNIYLNSPTKLRQYVARLMNLAGERPLLLAELGLDSRRSGEDVQAHTLEQQVRTVFAEGCAGTFVFSWTDEWHRGGCEIDDWAFGVTRRDRTPKPALASVSRAFSEITSRENSSWPAVSVVVCTFNGRRHIGETLTALQALDYPNYEVIVVDDGSTDETPAIAGQFAVRVIRTENRGLSSARNTGLEAATGDIVAYIDDDAYPDREWLNRLAMVLLSGGYAGVGGPNIPPPSSSLIAECVAHAPGGPIHVLLSDSEAEHIPGCNMAFWRNQLLEIGGFDPQFRVAGDDVDVCWRVQQQGWKLGFSPAATVFHYRRDSLSAYWRQQVGYGKAEALLERKWPDKYNVAGHLTWVGRIYNSRGLTPLWWRRDRIYQGTWGTAAYQRLYQPASTLLGDLPLLPEWYLVMAFLLMLSLIGFAWKPLLATVPVFILAGASSVTQAAINTAVASSCRGAKLAADWRALGIGLILHLMHPLARLSGRLKYGLHPWRRRGERRLNLPRRRTLTLWREEWQSHEEWLRQAKSRLRADAVSGGGYDNWDLETRAGMFGSARTVLAIEEHGGGRQLLRFRVWPRCSASGVLIVATMACLAIAAAVFDRSWAAAAVLGGIGLLATWRVFYECSLATQNLTEALRGFEGLADATQVGLAANSRAEAAEANGVLEQASSHRVA